MQRRLMPLQPIQPPAVLGVIGGGQLGRFFALAAQRLGYRVAVLDPDAGSPAMQVADLRVVAPYNDPAALDRLAQACAAVTVEFESVPAGSLAHVERRCATAPRAESIAVLQDRIREKRFLRGIGLPVVPFAPVIAAGDVAAAGCYPGILKLARQSYDGKGQVRVASASEALAAWRSLGEAPCVLERRVALDAEISVVLARAADGGTRAYPAAENRHRDGILELSVVPARVAPQLAAQAARHAQRIADCLDYVGVLAVEFFVSDGQLLVNEIAPRPHNSGHYTMEACAVSQFEQQVRALCNLPLGETTLISAAAMVNILGDAWRGGEPDWRRVLGASQGALHLYGKAQARPRRKMGHITVLRDCAADAAQAAEPCLAWLHAGAVAEERHADRRAA
jgi:5-(carboxyamino)imidazole ribonucleotide synthase